ncbi:MAG: protein kinase [Myxococcales bacterium]|nr:protein kinase [Myxococcales bacterium]MCB9643092.1 protein kinase [Myxococcales bacterium]
MKKQPLLDNRYLLKRKVGEGGFSQVYEAEHTTLGKTVAIKILTRGGEAARLRSEARSLAQLQHPNIVHVLDFGQDEHGLSYCVMEYVDGQTLKQTIEQHFPLSLSFIREVCQQLCSALDFIHTRHFIHRDLKPSNIMVVRRNDQKPQIKLFDFGIAKNHMENDSSLLNLTRPGFSLGTPYYMSPEQINGDPLLDHRTDLYSFGIILFEMLAGRPPFHAASRFALMEMHLHQPPPELPDRRCRPLLQQCIYRLLAKSPKDRYSSAMELWSELKEAFSECVALRDLPTDLLIEKQLGAVPDLSVMSQDNADSDEASVLDASVLGLEGAAIGGQVQSSASVSSSEVPLYSFESLLGHHEVLPVVVPEVDLQPEDEEDTAILFLDIPQEDQLPAQDYAVTSSWQRRLVQPQKTLIDADPWQADGEPSQAGEGAADDEDETHVRYHSVSLHSTDETEIRRDLEGTSSAELKRRQKALLESRSEETMVLEDSDDLLLAARRHVDPLISHPLSGLLRGEPQDEDKTEFRPADFEDGNASKKEASEDMDNSDEVPFHFLPTPEGQEAASVSGGTLNAVITPTPLGAPSSSATQLSSPVPETVAPSEKTSTFPVLDVQDPQPVEHIDPEKTAMEALRAKERGVGLSALGHLAEAEAALREALRKAPQDSSGYFHLGIVLGKMGRYREAEEVFRESIRLKPNQAAPFYNLGLALGKQDRLLETEEAFLKAIQLSPHKSLYHNELGIVLGRQRRYNEAEESFLKAIQLDPLDVSPYFNLGTALGQQGQYPRAEKVLKEAITLAPDDPSLFHQLAYILKAQKKNDEATRAFLQAQSLASRHRESA